MPVQSYLSHEPADLLAGKRGDVATLIPPDQWGTSATWRETRSRPSSG